jgi:3-hydroxyacyl-[acyl-carrier-protein] dehydratase
MPHSVPFLLVDRVIELEPGRRGKGIKNITADDPLLLGHFPDQPIMPGVLIVEACGQLAAVVCAAERVAVSEPVLNQGRRPLEILAMIERFKFLRIVTPGDQLILEAIIGKQFQNMTRIEVSARVGRNLIAEGTLLATRGA